MAKRNTYFQDEEIERKIDIRQFGRVLRYMLPYKKFMFLVGGLMAASAGVAMISPLLLKTIINEIVVVPPGTHGPYTENVRMLALVISGMAVLAALEIIMNYVHQRVMGSLQRSAAIRFTSCRNFLLITLIPNRTARSWSA